jgi:cell division protein FtsB
MRVADQLQLPTDNGTAPARRPRVRQRLRTPLEARQWRRRIAGYTLASLSFVLIVNALVGDNGYVATARATQAEQDLADQVRKVQDENLRMRDQIHRLKTDPEELENAARKYLHMSKPGEKVIIIKEAPKATTTPSAPASPAR